MEPEEDEEEEEPLAPEKRDDYIAASKDWAVWSSRRHFDPVDAERRAAEAFDRSFSPAGGDRQFGAIAASPDREPELADLAVPTLVIHGRDDTLIKPSGGFRTAEVIPGADLLLVGDMGHDLPVELHELVADAIAGHARRAG